MTDVRDDGLPTADERASWAPDDYRHRITDDGWRRARAHEQWLDAVFDESVSRCVAFDLKNLERRRLGLKALPERPRLSAGRMKEICDAARRPGFFVTRIPFDEYCMIVSYKPHRDALNRALGEGALAEFGS